MKVQDQGMGGAVTDKAGKDKQEEQKSLDESLHKLLIIGLALSVALILTGLVLSLINHQSLPGGVLPFGSIFPSVVALEASGFISLGLLVLIATPIIRVILSFISFLVERDWRFAGITLVVLIAVLVSILLGKY
jgi:uncharacterized membrane protein